MSANQKIILAIFIVYLALNAAIGIIFSNRQNKKQHTSSEKKFFIGGRNMNGLLLAMTTMATYTSVSSFISGPGAAGLTYGYAQAWIATVQVPITFLVLGVLGNKLALVSRRTGAVTVVGYLKARYKSDVLVIEDDEKSKILSYLLEQDTNGYSQFFKDLNDPKVLVELAWYRLFGQDAISNISEYWKDILKQERRTAKSNKNSSASQTVVDKTNANDKSEKPKTLSDLYDKYYR